jgi:hypothetical protein
VNWREIVLWATVGALFILLLWYHPYLHSTARDLANLTFAGTLTIALARGRRLVAVLGLVAAVSLLFGLRWLLAHLGHGRTF